MQWRVFFSFLFILVVFSLLFYYWFMPGDVQFRISKPGDSNFSVNSSFGDDMQFYENLRYKDSIISYKIENCPLGKEDEVKRSFSWIESKTMLKFYEVASNEEISVSCEDDFVRGEEGAFVAGEGGVTNVTVTENFNVIFNGKIILIRESNCADPLVGTHELLHALGFDHSKNRNNIMYYSVKCDQSLSEDIINKINYLYSFPGYPDLAFESAAAEMNGRYLNVEMTIRNNGLKDSEPSKIIISGDGEEIKEIDVESLSIGGGRKITLTNILVLKPKISQIELYSFYNGNELNKQNNKISLEINEVS